MPRDRSRLEALYKTALGLAPGERSAFVREACRGDEVLAAELDARLQQTVGDAEETRSVDTGGLSGPAAWGGLRILAQIGAGGFGRVYRAHDPTLARDVALKVIALRSRADAASVLREGQMLARVRHRNVVTVHSALAVGDEVGVTMELVEGQNLADLIRLTGPMGAEEAAVIGLSVCQALAAVHAAGLVHRDVKARNVMREQGGRIVLMDFGLGLDLLGAPETDGSLSGTPPYMAPELFDRRPATPAADVYSAGVLLFFLVTGGYPIQEESVAGVARAHARGERRYLADLRPDLPVPFVKVVEQALSPDPSLRFPTAGAMVRALGEAIPEAAAARPRASVESGAGAPESAGETRGLRRHVAWGAGFAGAVATVGALGLVTSSVFNRTLDRAGFHDESVAEWLLFGMQSLVTPVIYAVLTLGTLFALRITWRILRLTLRPVVERSEASARFVSQAVGWSDAATAAQWLLAAQTAALLVFVWSFYDVFVLITDFPDYVSPDLTARFQSLSYRPIAYRQVLSVLLVLSVLAWHSLLRSTAAARIDTAARAGAVIVSLLMLLVLTLPYRLLFLGDRPVVEHDGRRCYELGTRGEQVLVYCPSWDPPRIRVAGAGEVQATAIPNELIFNGR